MKVPIRLVVDSTADLPGEWLARWNILVVPAFVIFGDESFPDDGVAISRAEFYRRQATIHPKTSAPPPGLAQEIMGRALERAEHVIAMTVASRYSGIYNTVRLAAQQFDSARVTVYDSGSLSLGIGWQVLAAAEAIERGGTLDEVMAVIRDTRARVEIWGVAESLEYLRRSGRLNTVMASIGTLLQIKPIITLKEGLVQAAQRVRTTNKAMQALMGLVRECAPLEKLAILHANAPQTADALRAQVTDIAPPDTLMVDVSSVIGAHFGPGAFGAALVRASLKR